MRNNFKRIHGKSILLLLLLFLTVQSSIYAAKLDFEKTLKIDNVGPVASAGVSTQKKVDLNFNLGATTSVSDLAALQNKIEAIVKSQLLANNYDLQIDVTKSTTSGKVLSISANAVISQDGSVWVTKNNQVTDHFTTASFGGQKVKSIINANGTNLAITSEGVLWVWGLNVNGQLGLGNQLDYAQPQQLNLGGQKVISAVTNSGVTLAVTADGGLWGWGMNTVFAFQIPSNAGYTERSTPTRLNASFFGGKKIVDISISFNNASLIAIDQDGALWVWGQNYNQELGGLVGTFYVSTPTQLPSSRFGGQKVISVSIGYTFGMAQTADGGVWIWGANGNAEQGHDYSGYIDKYLPTRLSNALFGGQTVTQISAGFTTPFVLTADGSVWVWGDYNYGASGTGTSTFITTPYKMPMLTFGNQKIVAIKGGNYSGIALSADGSVWVWGYNANGVLGDGTITHQMIPIQIPASKYGGQKVKLNGSDIISNLTTNAPLFRPNADQFFIEIADNSIDEFQDINTRPTLVSLLQSYNFSFIGLGTSTNQADIQSIYQQSTGEGQFINNTNIDSSLQQVVNYVLNKKYADIKVDVGNTSAVNLASVQSKIEAIMKPTLASQNIRATFSYVNGSGTPNEPSLLGILNTLQFKVNTNHYLIHISDRTVPDLQSTSTKSSLYNSLLLNNIHYVGLGTPANQADMLTIAAQSNNYGGYTSNTPMDTALANVTNYVISTATSTVTSSIAFIPMWKNPTTGIYASSAVSYSSTYSDYESDPAILTRYKFEHNSSIYDNNMGNISDSGLYRTSPYTIFDHSGKYTVYYGAKDNPLNDWRFDNFKKWSDETLSPMVFYVHHAPEPQIDITVTPNGSTGNYNISSTDSSYDLDHISNPDKGIVARILQYKNVKDAAWTTITSLPTSLPPNNAYYVWLQVKDYEGTWNQIIKPFETTNANLAPVAKFTLTPTSISLNQAFTIVDSSYDPNGDPIAVREWTVKKDGVTLYLGPSQPTTASVLAQAMAYGLQRLGTYTVSLRVQDAPSVGLPLWSNTDIKTGDVINHAPAPLITFPSSVYRDDNTVAGNTTVSPDVDGDAVTYKWTVIKGATNFNMGTAYLPTINIKSVGLGKTAVDTDWQIQLEATDINDAKAYATLPFTVLNRIPTAAFNGVTTANLADTKTYTSTASDLDSEDLNHLIYTWQVIKPSGIIITGHTNSLNVKFDESGDFVINHWVVDPVGAKSNTATKSIHINANQVPVVTLVANPTTVYRGDEVTYTSTKSDADNAIVSDKYYLTIPGYAEYEFSPSNLDLFTYSYSVVGSIMMREVVTDGTGLSAQAIASVQVINHPPTLVMVTPTSEVSAAPTIIYDIRPTISWTYADIEGDSQKQYNVTIYKHNTSSIISSSGNVSSGIQQWLSTTNLVDGITYDVDVKVYDGYDWSTITRTYFKYVANRPPTGNLSFITPIYQNDTPTFTITQSDPDLDFLTIKVDASFNGGGYTNIQSWAGVPSGAQKVFSYGPLAQGSYTLKLTLDDLKGGTFTQTYTFTVLALSISGNVAHTAAWESNRQIWNMRYPTNSRASNVFWAGEAFVLGATVTNTGTSSTKPTSVTAELIATSDSSVMTASNQINFTGEMLNTNFYNLLTDGSYIMRFTVTWNNGLVQANDVMIVVKDNIFDVIVVQLRN